MTAPQYAPAGPAPLDQPQYGASLPAAVSRFFKKYATFSGRASRSEFWWWALVSGVVTGVLYIGALIGGADGATVDAAGTAIPGPGAFPFLVLLLLWGLATLVPGLALTVRRFHDGGFSGWMVLLGLVPFVGGIILLVFELLPSKPEGARFDAR